MKTPSSLEELIDALRCLPGVGPKSAQRMAFHLLQRDHPGALRLGRALDQALTKVRHCERCNNFTELPVCELCSSQRRDQASLCVVETPADLLMMEQAQVYDGMYFVLMGRLSPLDGIGPEEIGIPRLEALLDEGTIKEVVLATNLTVEGEATAHYISDLVRARHIKATRIAYGVPIGGELEYTDRNTLARALAGRREA